MTFCKKLKSGTSKSGKTVVAYELTDKHSDVPHYEVTLCNDTGLEIMTSRCAKSTWRKIYNSWLQS